MRLLCNLFRAPFRPAGVRFEVVRAGGWQVAHEWRYFLKSRPRCQSLLGYWMRVGNMLAAKRVAGGRH